MDIAIIGMSGRFPEADSIADFYRNLCEGRDSVRPISERRLRNTNQPIDSSYFPSGFIEDIDLFDNEFFHISVGEAQHMDPHQRMIMEVVYETLENSGYSMNHFNGSNTSLFIGDTHLEYVKMAENFDPTLITGNMNAAIAGRIARYFNLRGSAMMIDTTCSSSLVALHYAVNELVHGDAEHALVAGVRLTLFPIRKIKEFDAVGIISPEGKAKTFSSEANGTGGGEAVVCVLLKPYEKALQDEDIIHAVIKGSAVNQDANLSGSLTAPSSVAQSEVIRKAWIKAKIDPLTVDYIEAHGTGTKLGDPIEIQGISEAFKSFTNKKQFCAISSVKTNIGHTGSAAGLVGLIKAVLSLKYKKLFPSLHFNSPNPFIDFENSPVYVNAELKQWDKQEGMKRKAGVSSFGLSGTNCHIILEEGPYFNNGLMAKADDQHVFTVSGKSEYSLKSNLAAMQRFAKHHPETSPSDFCYALLSRQHYAYRYSKVIRSVNDVLSISIENDIRLRIRKSKNNGPALFLLFPDQQLIRPELITQLCEQYPEFNSSYQSVRDSLKGVTHTLNFQKFSFQYCFCELLQMRGIKSNVLVGDGIGQLVATALTSGIQSETLAANLNNYTSSATKNILERCQALIDRATAVFTIFAEIGFNGTISQELLRLKTADSNYEVVHLNHSDDSLVLDFFSRLYQAGLSMDWSGLASRGAKKMELPSYQFDRKRCWIREPDNRTIDSWLYELEWQIKPLLSKPVEFKDNVILVFCDEYGIADRLCERLGEDNNSLIMIKVKPADKFAMAGSHYTINAAQEDDYIKLELFLKETGVQIDGILNLNHFTSSYELESKTFNSYLFNGVYSQFFIAKAFHHYFGKRGFRYGLVTSNAYQVNQQDAEALPVNAMVSAFVKGLLCEYPSLNVMSLDLAFQSDQIDEAVANIMTELASDDGMRFVCYRNNKRYVSNLVPIKKIEKNNYKQNDDDVYLITGGLSGIGLELSKLFAKQSQCHLIILGRTELPSRKKWSEPHAIGVGSKIDALRTLENYGARVDYHGVDISDFKKMEKIFSSVKKKVRKLKAVIHCAGVAISGVPIKDKLLVDFETTIKPKVQGTVILDEMTSGLDPEYFLCFSSLNAIVPQRNSVDYAAANAFEDAYARLRNRSGAKFLSINWPGWSETGMSFRKRQLRKEEIEDMSGLRSIRTTDGIDAILYSLSLDRANVLVADIDMHLLATNPFFVTQQNSVIEHLSEEISLPVVPYSDKELTYTEAKLIAIWYEVLKSPLITPDDDFFDLGGHSLNGTQILNRVERELHVSLEFDDLLEHGTVKNLAVRIDAMASKNEKVDYSIISSAPVRPWYDLSHAQRRLWFLSQLDTDQFAYNMPGAYHIDGKLDLEALRKTFKTIIDRHEILRTVFMEDNGEPKQKILAAHDLNFEIAFSDFTETNDRELKVRAAVMSEANFRFDLSSGPLIRAHLLKTGESKFVFILTRHHIISDHWSLGLLSKEITKLYNAYAVNGVNHLKPPRIQYKDYSEWQNALLNSEKMVVHRDYWLNTFKGDVPVIDLATDFRRPPVKTFNGGSLNAILNSDLVSSIRKLSKTTGASLFMILVASVKVLLHRYTGSQDIVVGSPIASRGHSDLEDQLGLYQNTLALRTIFNGEEGFEQLVRKVKEITLLAYEHQSYPFDNLVDELNLVRDTSRSPIFDVMVLLQNMQKEESISMQGLTLTPFDYELASSKFDLTFDFYEAEDRIFLRAEFNSDLFRRERIEQMLTHYLRILELVLSDDQQPIGRLEYLSKKEESLLESFNHTIAEYPDGSTLAQLFEKQVMITPDAVAVVFEDHVLTYDQVNSAANRLACFLRSFHSVTRNDIIGVMLNRSERMIVVLLGILKSGAAYLPIDPDYPKDRIKYSLTDAQVKVLIVDSFTCDQVSPSIAIINIDEKGEWAECSPLNLEGSNTPDDLAYVIYTSGSTGRPKGVMVEHRGVVNRIDWMAKYYHFDSSDIVLQKTPNVFDVSVWELFMPLILGAKQIAVTKKIIGDPHELVNYIAQHKVTTLHFVASMLNAFVESLDDSHISKLASLRHVMTSGEAVLPETVKRYYDKLNVPLHNLYGPTEASVDVSCYETKRGDVVVPIGKPISNMRLFIVDRNLNAVPVGIKGEIAIAGVGVARGYLNRVELSAERFTKIDILGQSERIYRTGDIARWLPDGNIEFFGRSDNQVKIRGFRIELEEVENVLIRHDDIEHAAVLPTLRYGDHQLVAFYTGRREIEQQEIRQFLSGYLPDYMLPALYVRLDKFGFNSNGKLDRFQLTKMDLSVYGLNKPENKPRNRVEELLQVIWKDILNREVGIFDSFFEVGGNSLSATKLVSRIYKEFSIRIALAEIFRSPTINSLGRMLAVSEQTTYQPIVPIPHKVHYDLSHSQKQLWIQSQLESETFSYNVHETYLFEGVVDEAAFHRTFDLLVDRHESLRTVFIMVDGEPKQRILDREALGFELAIADFRDATIDLLEMAEKEKYFHFDLTQGPLIRAKLIRLENDKYGFLLTVHHLITDGWSMEVLIRDVLSLYNTITNTSNKRELPRLSIQYRDYAHWHNTQLAGDNASRYKSYWHKKLGGNLTKVRFPVDSHLMNTNDAGVGRFSIGPGELPLFENFCVQHNVTVFMLITTCLKTLLHKYTGENDITIGTPVSGREASELEDQIGYYLNTLALRDHINPTMPFIDFLSQVKQTILDGFLNQLYPIEKLVDELAVNRSARQTALFDVGISWQNFVKHAVRTDDQAFDTFVVHRVDTRMKTVPYDIWFFGFETGHTIDVSVIFRKALYEQSTIDKICNHFRLIIHQAINQPSWAIKDILESIAVYDQKEQEHFEFLINTKIDEDF